MPREFIHADDPGTEIDSRVAPEPGDIVVRKTRVGPFLTTDLDQQLRGRGVDTLVLADASTDPDPEVDSFLMEKVLPRQAEVIEVAQLHRVQALIGTRADRGGEIGVRPGS